MQFDPLHPTHSAIIEVLATSSGLSVSDVHTAITQTYTIEVSTQNLYRIIAQMTNAGILLREKGKLNLSLKWLRNLSGLVSQAEALYLENTTGRVITIPEIDGQKQVYTGTSLRGIDYVWDHLVLKLCAYTNETNWYEYGSHPYHVLALPSEEIPFYTNLTSSGIHHHILIGNQTFLDQHGTKLLSSVCETRMTDTPPFPKEGHILMICGDYIVEMILPSSITDHLASFYSTVHEIHQFEAGLYRDIFDMKATCKITIRKSNREAAILRAKCAQYFT